MGKWKCVFSQSAVEVCWKSLTQHICSNAKCRIHYHNKGTVFHSMTKEPSGCLGLYLNYTLNTDISLQCSVDIEDRTGKYLENII